jgi:probable F420-dependent oxidoreductase
MGAGIRTDAFDAKQAAEVARRLERQGYSAAWLTDSMGRDPLVHASWLLAATEHLIVAIGVVNLYLRSPIALVGAQNALAEQSEGRFLLGLGVSHAEMVEGLLGRTYADPVGAMSAYLDAMQTAPYMGPPLEEPAPIVLGALGPRMLQLAAQRTAGACPVRVSPEYTARARQLLGPDAWLCVKQYVLLETSASRARAAARQKTSLEFENYRRHLRRMGFGDADFEAGGSDRLIDTIFAWGDESSIRERLEAHLGAGADHVVVEPIDPDEPGRTDFRALEVLSPGL